MRGPLLLLALLPAAHAGAAPPVRTGADVLVRDRLALLHGKRVGVITNHTGRLADTAKDLFGTCESMSGHQI